MSLSEILKSRKPPSGSIIAEEKARVYIRVSHDRSAEKNLSPEVQKRQIIAHTTSKGYQIKEWYEDLAKSAFRDDDLRTEFHRMVEDAKADPETTVLVVSNYDRFSRQRERCAPFEHDLDNSTCAVPQDTKQGHPLHETQLLRARP